MTTSAIIVVGIAIVVLLAIICARGHANKRLAAKNHELSAALRQFERKAKESEAVLKQAERRVKESEAALKQAERKIAGLEEQISSLFVESASKQQLCEEGVKLSLALPPDGREVFLPLLDPRRVYQITVHGTCAFLQRKGFLRKVRGQADAIYRTDEVGNFLQRHGWLRLGEFPINHFFDEPADETKPEEDREGHRYSFRIDSAEKKIAASFHVTSADLLDQPKGSLTLTVELLPEATPSPGARRRKEAREESGWRSKEDQLAERMMVAPAPPPDEDKKKKEALARKLRQDEIQADEKIARAKLKAEKICKAKAELESIPLVDEERERLETELIQDIFELGKEGGNNGQDGTTL